ncbi:hypothetical protein [Paenibacillus thiaminolyticus]|uniref:hypothetical protein n=1 Tax=Paenibacillus thiaminolyticus TaxID=49283 RepID=UPI0025434F74|nr:hypothetical protein [Paenibacillus thiaminolyticus]WII39707.1 hypothetical protein O0V01_11690 [Paenibacillus thiaminolyticus]
MGAFGGLILTNKGRALQAKAQTGIELKYTRIKVGDGKLGGQSIPTLNNLISPKKSLDIKKLEVRLGKAVVGSMLSNAGLESGFYFREIGVFAQDPEEGEILYCYANAGDNSEYIPPEGGPDVIEKYINVVTIVQNAPNVSAVIDGSLIYPTNKEMEVAIKEYFDANNNAKILPSKSFKASDVGTLYPKGMSIFWLDRGIDSGWPADNGQVVTWYTAGNRLNQIFFETDVRSQRVWSRRWSSTSAIWSDFLEQETTAGTAKALNEAKAYTDEKTATIDAPVKSVNGKTGEVALTAADVGAVEKEYVDVKANVLLADIDLNTAEIARHGVAIDELKKSGVDAKNRIAGAISAKGVQASANDTWPTLETKIHQIPTGTGTAGGSHTASIEFNLAAKQQGVEHTLVSWGPPPNIKKIRTIHYAAMDLEKSRFYSEATGDFVRLYLEDNTGIRWRLASSLLAGLKDVYILSWYITLDDGPGLYPKAHVKFLNLNGYKTESNITNPPKGFNLDGDIRFVVTAYQQNSASTVTAALAGWVVYSWKG